MMFNPAVVTKDLMVALEEQSGSPVRSQVIRMNSLYVGYNSLNSYRDISL